MGPVTHTARVPMEIESHREMALFQVANLKNHELNLGMPCLRKHSPTIEWKDRKITFNSERCTTECLGTSQKIHAVSEAVALEQKLITRLSYMEIENQKVLVKQITPDAKIAAKETIQAAGYYIYASEKVEIPPQGQETSAKIYPASEARAPRRDASDVVFPSPASRAS